MDVAYERFLGPEIFFNPEICNPDYTTPLPKVCMCGSRRVAARLCHGLTASIGICWCGEGGGQRVDVELGLGGEIATHNSQS